MPGSIGVYGVSATDVAAELPGLFPVGFTQAQKPTLATVEGWIADADAFIDAIIGNAVAITPADWQDQVTNAATRLAKRYVINDIKDRVYEAVAAARMTPSDLAQLRANSPAKTILDQIKALPDQIIAANEKVAETASRVGVNPATAQRPLLVDDCDLDPRAPRHPYGSTGASGIDWGRY